MKEWLFLKYTHKMIQTQSYPTKNVIVLQIRFFEISFL